MYKNDVALKINYYLYCREGAQIMVNNLLLEDAKEGIDSFVEKRKPRFHH